MMFRSLFAPALAVALAACGTVPAQAPLPPVTVSGPVFSEGQFSMPPAPLPPDPSTVGNRAASSGAYYENKLRAADNACRIRLDSVGRQLDAAGLVEHATRGVQ